MTYRAKKLTAALIGALILMIIVTLTALAGKSLAASAASSKNYVLGDANGDGYVTVSDVTCIQMVLADVPVSEKYSKYAADVNRNGVTELDDAVAVQQWIADIKTPFLIGEWFSVPVETTVQPATEPLTTETPTQTPTDDDGWGRTIFQP